jgi:TRAP-type C4-dicarboxylate transport system permease large subunit
MVIDSISIMLLTVTIFESIAVSMGYDPIAFAIFPEIATYLPNLLFKKVTTD